MIRVVHVIGNLRLGGGQKLTYSVVDGLPRDEFDASVVCLEEGGAYADLLTAKGRRVTSLGSRKDYGPAGLWRSRTLIRQVRDHLRAVAPHVVHTHLFGAGVVGRLAAWRAGVPHVATTLHRIFYGIQPLAERFLSTRTDRVVVDSQAVADLVVTRCRIPRHKIQVIYNGIDPDELGAPEDETIARARIGVPDSWLDPAVPIVAVIAHLQPHKGQRDIVEAIARLKGAGSPAKLLLVGDGPDRPLLTSRVAQLGLEDVVHFAGYRKEIRDAISAATVVALPSQWEGFGIALAEAMYLERPVIGTTLGGAAEVVAPGETGILVPFGDVSALAEAIDRLVSDSDLRARYGRAGHLRAARLFSRSSMIDAYARLYRDMVGEGSIRR